MNEQDLEFFLEKNKELITIDNAKRVFQAIAKKIYDIDDDGKIFYDFLGEVLLANPNFLEGRNYTKLIQSYNANFRMIDPTDPINLEKYFLEKYCIFDDEEIIFSFYGAVNYLNYRKGQGLIFSDRVFITNHRIIVFSATYGEKGVGSSFIPITGIFNLLTYTIDRQIRKTIKKERDAKRNEFFSKAVTVESDDKLFFGYQFPISNPTAITLEKWKKGKKKGTLRRLTFNSKFELQSYDLGILVSKIRYENWEEILHRIREILQNLQAE